MELRRINRPREQNFCIFYDEERRNKFLKKEFQRLKLMDSIAQAEMHQQGHIIQSASEKVSSETSLSNIQILLRNAI